MEVSLGWYESFVIVNVKVEVFFGKGFNIAVLISDAAWSTKGCRGMTITDLVLLALRY